MRARPLADVAAGIAALGLAVCIYLGWRDHLAMHAVLPGLAAGTHKLASHVTLPAWARYSLPDALWQFAASAIVLGIWHEEPWGVKKLCWALVPLLAGTIIEVGQYLGVLEGTFDWVDVLFSVGASVAALALTSPPLFWHRGRGDERRFALRHYGSAIRTRPG